MTWWLAAPAAALLAALGAALRWLSPGGAAAAALVGTAVFWGAGPAGALLLAAFFISGSWLSARHAPDQPPRRNARQVLANGAWAAAAAVAMPWRPAMGWAALVGALATAQADTWATEIGLSSTAPPRLVTTGARVPPGTSGAVTGRGTMAGALGAGVLSGLALLVGAPRSAAVAGGLAGLLGMAADSILGATAQAVYRCPVCARRTEQRVHACGSTTQRIGGWAWLDNDGVNLAATTTGALGAVALLGWLGR